MIEVKDMDRPLSNTGVLAYWDFYDYMVAGKIIEKGRGVKIRATPQFGEMIIGVPGKPNAIIRDFKFSGIREKLPCYDVFI